MDPSDDWCYFEKIGDLGYDFCAPKREPYSTQYIAVCNYSSYIILAKDTKIVLILTKMIEEYAKGTIPPQHFEKDFGDMVTHVFVNQTGSLAAVACGPKVHILSVKKFLRNQESTITLNLENKVR